MAKKDNVSDVLERHGVRYFVALATVFYAVGTIIFNVYLRKLGSFEFDLLQLRYMFVGLAFVLITAVFPLIVWGIYGLIKVFKKEEAQPKGLTPGQRSKLTRAKHDKKAKTFSRWRLGFFIALPFWLAFYAWNIFPLMPSGFGGARPYAARLIGSAEAIQKINDQIAFEAGVPVDTLSFEEVPGKSGLTTGANVLILDKSNSRIFLLLTRDLYLSSTSNFAKKMIELGKIPDNLATGDTKKFQVKPLIVSAEGVEGITLSLYEPPEITTTADLQLAAEIVAATPKSAKDITDVISAELPGVGEKIVAAVQKHQKENPVVTVNKTKNEPVVLPEISLEEVITDVIAESVDTTFLNFRALAFSQSGNLITIEHRNGKDDERRRQLIQMVTKTFEEKFPVAWAKLDPVNNFLATGQNDPDFPQKVQAAFRGAKDAEEVMSRLNNTEVGQPNLFPTVKEGALAILKENTGEDTSGTRALLATQLIKYFNDTAPENRASWESTYVTNGVEDESYLLGLNALFTEPTTWKEFVSKSVALMNAMNAEPDPTCTDEIKNGDETGVDCGGNCEACPVAETCSDGILNQDEIEVDCGGVCEACVVSPTCTDEIKNGDETGVDCGGNCEACVVVETCADGILNQDETEIDCGGVCEACVVLPTCTDEIQNGDETGVDCGGSCEACMVAGTCTDSILNQDETEIDCGGVCDACTTTP